MSKLKLKVFQLDQVSFEGECDIAFFPAVEGKMAVMYDHTRFMTPLKKGKIEIKNEGSEQKDLEIDEGFLVVTKEGAKVLLA